MIVVSLESFRVCIFLFEGFFELYIYILYFIDVVLEVDFFIVKVF